MRDRILDAAVETLTRLGWPRTSVSTIATAAGVSRPTVYSYFPDRDLLLSAVIERAAISITARLVESASRATNASDFVLALVMTVVREFRADPSASLLGLVRPGVSPLSEQPLAIARRFLEPLSSYRPDLVPELDEIAETVVRFLLSLLMYDSPRTRSPRLLRAYLERRLLPALGLPPPGRDAG